MQVEHSEINGVLKNEVLRVTELGYEKLQKLAESKYIETKEVTTSSGINLQIEINLLWDDHRGGTIRVAGNADCYPETDAPWWKIFHKSEFTYSELVSPTD